MDVSLVESITKEYQQKLDELAAAKKKMQEELTIKLDPIFKQFFVENPKIKQIVWTQYTPFFNDGEPCVFSVHDKYFVPTFFKDEDTGELVENEEYEYHDCPSLWSDSFYDSAINEFKACGLTDEEIDRVEKFGKFLNSIPDDLYEGIYGDHVEITVTTNGAEVNEYDHD